MGVDLRFMWCAAREHSVRALVDVADGKALIVITASCSSPQAKELRGAGIWRTRVFTKRPYRTFK